MSKQRKSNFRGKVNPDAKRQKTAGYGYLNLPKGVSVFSPPSDGKVWLDFLPYEVTDERHPDKEESLEIAIPGTLWYKRPFKTHRGVGVDNDSVVCLASIGKKCPICEYRSKRVNEGDAGEKELKALKNSLRNLYVVIPIDSKKYEEELHIWDMSWHLFQKMLNNELEEKDEYEVFPDLEEGLTLRIRFDETTIGNSKPFGTTSRIDFEERDEAYNEKILDEVPNLDEVLNILSYKDLHAKFFEMEDEESPEEEQDDEQESKPARKKKPMKRKTDEGDDDDKETDTVKIARVKREKEKEKKKLEHERRKEQSESKDNRCPHDHKFGKECEDHDECDDCELWNDCYDEKHEKE